MLDYGADLNLKDCDGLLPFMLLMRACLEYRQIVEMFFYQNPDLDVNQLALTNSIRLDAFMNNKMTGSIFGSGSRKALQMDAKWHAIFKHDA